MTKKLMYAEIVKAFLPKKYNIFFKFIYEDILKAAQQMAQEHHLSMDTPLTAESFLKLQINLTDQLIKDIIATEDPTSKAISEVNRLISFRAQMINDKDTILASLQEKGLSDRDAAVALSRGDANIIKILSYPPVNTIGGFIIALQSIATP